MCYYVFYYVIVCVMFINIRSWTFSRVEIGKSMNRNEFPEQHHSPELQLLNYSNYSEQAGCWYYFDKLGVNFQQHLANEWPASEYQWTEITIRAPSESSWYQGHIASKGESFFSTLRKRNTEFICSAIKYSRAFFLVGNV